MNIKTIIKIIDNTAIWGIFSDLSDVLGDSADKVKKGQANEKNTMWNFAPPYCICYVTPENKIFIKRLLYVGLLTRHLGLKRYKKSGGKEIGKVEK
jgi:hypothetical protein